MTTSSRVRTAGVIGMIGGVLWIIGVIMQYSLGLFESDGSLLHVVHQLIALLGMSGAMVGFLGLLWGRAFRGRLGPLGVVISVIGYGLIVIGGLVMLVIDSAESPIFLLFPIGGNLSNRSQIVRRSQRKGTYHLLLLVPTTKRTYKWLQCKRRAVPRE